MKKLVFLVEDDLVMQKQLQLHFEEVLGNYTVRTFDHPAQMMAELGQKPFAVVLDHYFNDSSGATGLDFLRQLREKHKNIAVIYYTTLDDETVRNQVMQMGAERYIIKNSASLVHLRTALDALHQKYNNRGFFERLFS